MTVRLDGADPRDRTPPCDRDADPLCAGDPVFDDYSLEVVQRIGYDSFTPDNGVLIAKNKDRQNGSCGYGCHAWVIDAHPEDIDMVDYVHPGTGEPVMRTIADYRQLNDALFHAGLRSGSEFEFVDEPNRLHFYVIDRQTDADGVLSYTLGVRSLDEAGAQARGVSVDGPAPLAAGAPTPATLDFTLRNTGAASSTPVDAHLGAPAAAFASDIYRVSVSVDGESWDADVQNVLVAVEAGQSATVPVFIRQGTGSGATTVTLTVVSESDPSARATASVTVGASPDRVDVWPGSS
jgi:hypothetical protein